MNGWIKLHRQIMQWEWYDNSEMVHLFIHMLMKANRELTTWRGIPIQPGQFVSGRKALSAETGISEATIRTSINRLQASQQLTSKPTNKYTLFTLTNWGFFQDTDGFLTSKPVRNQPANQPATNQLTNQQPTTNKKDKKEDGKKREEKKPTKKDFAPPSLEEFDSFWEGCHVRTGSRPVALKSWEKMRMENRTQKTWQELQQAFNKLVDIKKQENNGVAQYVPHISTWISQDRWDEELVEPPKKFPFNLPTVLYNESSETPHVPELNGKEVYYEDKYDGRVFGPDGTLCTRLTYYDGVLEFVY